MNILPDMVVTYYLGYAILRQATLPPASHRLDDRVKTHSKSHLFLYRAFLTLNTYEVSFLSFVFCSFVGIIHFSSKKSSYILR